MDWQLFRTEIEGEIIMRGGYADLHERADFLTRTIVNALDRQAPLTAPKKRFEPDWWTEELADLRGRIDKLSRRKRRRPEETASLAVLKDNYKHKIKEAKRESFRKFCSSPSSVSEMAGLVKAMLECLKAGMAAVVCQPRCVVALSPLFYISVFYSF